jgi:hypothetical protein
MDISEFFKTYVIGWICEDIDREIRWAKAGNPAGNALYAMGLLAYTEFMAKLLPAQRRPSDGARLHFEAFFRELGSCYADLLDNQGMNVYDIFRCGLVHEYFVKGTCTVAMLNSSPGNLEVYGAYENSQSPPVRLGSSFIPKPLKCGLGIATNGSYYFIVEKYYEDFRSACEALLVELTTTPQSQHPTPPIDFPILSDTG